MRQMLLVLLFCMLSSCIEPRSDKKAVNIQDKPLGLTVSDSAAKSGEWMKHINRLDTTNDCIRKVIRLVYYLDTETLSHTYTFEDYPVKDTITHSLAPLDINSCKSAHAFRTNIKYELGQKGVNFAGKYSIVSVGMTGWGLNYWIVDRTTGKAYDLPYRVDYIQFRKNSSLIIVDSRNMLLGNLQAITDPKEACDIMFPDPKAIVDVRPSYFLWQNNKLVLLGQKHSDLPVNNFWEWCFGKKYH